MKQKVCSRCEKPKRIWANNMCKSCDIVSNPSKYMIKRSEVKKTTTKSKKKPLPTISKLKKELDDIFSKYIRLKYSNEQGDVACYTCGKEMNWKSIQNGHFFSRSAISTRWSEDNCRPQCVGCNVFKHGNYIEYTRRLLREIGQDNFDKLEMLKNETLKMTRDEYMRLINEYTLKVAQYNY